MPLSLVVRPGFWSGPTKSCLSNEMLMLAPESQMTLYLEPFGIDSQNLAGACRAIRSVAPQSWTVVSAIAT